MNDNLKLYELPQSEFELGGQFDARARKAGYSSGRAAANEIGLWNVRLQAALRMLREEPKA